ncbi:exopolysaccharide biosynthesis polyprenyl glycosylphosphotransferase [Flavobacterium panacis]|nr:exopolysaccharide biosynthesis polyprenyl glycosylphosphotransferase [Flavobacterium panacis]MCR4029645.1 exopolysaccharide biosynthesis polyprenyl glycosylphosphotransferase [Flavobacterium panacis]
MRNRHKFTFIFCSMAADFCAVVASVFFFLHFAANANVEWTSTFATSSYLIAAAGWILAVLYFNLYRLDTVFSLPAFYRSSWRVFLCQFLFWQSCIVLFQGLKRYQMSVDASTLQFSFLLFYLLLSRIGFTYVLNNIKSWVKKPFTVAIWGFNPTSIQLASKLESNSYFFNFLGIINDADEDKAVDKASFNHALINIIHSASEKGIQELYIVVKTEFIDDLNTYFELADRYCIRLKFVPDLSSISKFSFSSTSYENFHIIRPRHEPLQNAYNRLVKRVFDIVFSLLVITFVLSWLYPILAIIIKRQSKGPVLFKQLRTGKKNQSFYCYKFRSMAVNTDSDSVQAKKGDMRVTPIGKFIRRTSLDELPQFFNVLQGDMSVVGPRPHMIKHTEDYNSQINDFMVRHFVKPGITGLAQISGHRGETKKVSDMKKRVKADIEYLQNWSLIKDLKICLLTVVLTLKGDENAF